MATVLIADNDRAVSGLLVELLQRSGLRPLEAHDGQTAARMAREPGLRVLVCDLDMPGATGLEVLESLRDMLQPPPAVVISGYLDSKIEQRLAELPFVREVLGKPFDLTHFTATVRRLAGIGEGGDSAASAVSEL